MGMINTNLKGRTIYSLFSLLILICLFLSANSYADNKSDISELENFYHQVFSTQTVKTTSKVIKKPLLTRQKSRVKTKDPELVAFYETVFGKNTGAVSETKIRQKTPINIKKPIVSAKKNKVTYENRKIVTSDYKNHSKHNTVPSTEVHRIDSSSRQPQLRTKRDKREIKEASLIINTPENEVAKEKPRKNTTSSENKNSKSTSLSSQVQKIDTKALFEQAFGKKNRKNRAKAKSKKTNANTNDMASLFAKAFGKKSAISVPSDVKVDFRVNASTIGEVQLFSDSSGDMSQANTENLLELFKEVLKEPFFLIAETQFAKTKKVPLDALNKLGVFAVYNSTNLSLDVEIPPKLRKPQILSLLRKKKVSVREENIIEANKVSGYINAFSNIGVGSRDSDANLRMRLEGSLNIGGGVLESTGDYINEKFDIGRTVFTYDRPEKLQRIALGNISTGSRNFQENIELEGIRFSKEFFLDPDLQISPKANEPLQLATNSEVELYVNNQLIRRFNLKAGVYRLEDIGLYNGANNIRIRIKDEFGKVTVKTSKQYYDSHLLKPGLSLFAISVGYLSNQNSTSNSSFEKKPIFSGYYQKGISKDLTLSLDAQLSSENYIFGAESMSSIPIGSLKNSIAISGGKDRETGFATSFEFRPNKKQEEISLDTLRKDLLSLDTRSRGFLNNWSISGEYRNQEFDTFSAQNSSQNYAQNSNLSAGPQTIDGVTFENRVFNSNKLRANLQTNFNLNISEQWRGNLSLGVADYYDSDDGYYANFTASRRFDNGIRLNLGTRYDSEDKFSMNLQLSIPLDRKKGNKKKDLDLLVDSQDNSYESKLRIKPTGLFGENSLAGSLEYFENKTSRQENIDLEYRNTHFESNFTARNNYDKSSKNSSQQFNLGFNTSIACVGTSCASSYPIDDSFALVSGPSNQIKPIALSNNNTRFRYSDDSVDGLPDNYSALITGKGKKAVVQLDSYRTQNINVDEGTLPNGYDSEKTEFSMFPKYHQGFLLKAGGEPATSIDGMLFDEKNQVLGFKGGQWIPVNGGKAVAFFSNKGGRFRVTSIPAGKYKLELFDYPNMSPISKTIPDTKGKLIDIGKLIIKTNN